MYALWRKPPKETEKTHRWGRIAVTEAGFYVPTYVGTGSGSNVLLNEVLALPFRLTSLLLRLVVRVLSRGLKIWK